MPGHNLLPHCPSCGVAPGERHTGICGIARCKACGWQASNCDCDSHVEVTAWTGRPPGEVECEEYGLLTSEADRARLGWGTHDLNTLSVQHARGELVWCSQRERLVRPQDNPVEYVIPLPVRRAQVADILIAYAPDLGDVLAGELAAAVLDRARALARGRGGAS